MTTLVYRDGVLAADSQATSFDRKCPGTHRKVAKLPSGHLVGIVGDLTFFRPFLDEFDPHVDDPLERCGVVPDDDHTAIVVVDPDGSVRVYSDCSYWEEPIDAPYLAYGSGSSYALGAMASGSSARTAVEQACKYDIYSSGRVLWVSLFDDEGVVPVDTPRRKGPPLRKPRKVSGRKGRSEPIKPSTQPKDIKDA